LIRSAKLRPGTLRIALEALGHLARKALELPDAALRHACALLLALPFGAKTAVHLPGRLFPGLFRSVVLGHFRRAVEAHINTSM